MGQGFFSKTGFKVAPGATPADRKLAFQQALEQSYSKTSDWTVGTMEHELSHATNGLPDVDFQAPSTYEVAPPGLTRNGWEQVSTPDLDLALAVARPDLAVLNVDNYGQCVCEALEASGQ